MRLISTIGFLVLTGFVIYLGNKQQKFQIDKIKGSRTGTFTRSSSFCPQGRSYSAWRYFSDGTGSNFPRILPTICFFERRNIVTFFSRELAKSLNRWTGASDKIISSIAVSMHATLILVANFGWKFYWKIWIIEFNFNA